MDNYIKLSDCAFFSEKRINVNELTTQNYISTDNMVPNKGGIIEAIKLPEVKTVSAYQIDDILLSNIRPYFKKIWIAESYGGCSNDVLVLSVHENYDPRFVYYALCDNNFFNYATVTSKGTKMPRGTPSAIMKYLIPKIDYNKQIIVSEILLNYDKIIENNNKRIKILEQMTEEVFKEWFVRFRYPCHENDRIKNGIPQGWHMHKVITLVKRLPFGVTYKKSEVKPEGKTIVIDQSSKLFLGYHDNEPSHKATYERPILLFGDHTCKNQLMTTSFSLGENIIPYVSIDDEKINRYYLFYATKNILATEEYKRHWKRFVNMKILIPDIDLQVLFQSKVITLQMQINNLLKINRNLLKQRDLLLPRLMSGKLEIKESG